MKKIKKRIENREIVQTRYLDIFTLKSLNIYDEMQTLLTALGWERFVHKQESIYTTLVHEFISSLSTNAHKYELDPKLTMHFRCMDKDRVLSLDEFHHIFGLPTDGMIRMPTSKQEYNDHKFWQQIAPLGGAFKPGQDKASKIENHSLRLL